MTDYGMFTDKSNIVAVVGVSTDEDKYGYRVYKTLKDNGYAVFAVNPKYDKVGSDKVYHDLESLPKKPTLVITVVPRAVTYEVVEKCKELGIPRVWMQPGSESPEAVEFCKKNGIDVVYKSCYIVNGMNTCFTG